MPVGFFRQGFLRRRATLNGLTRKSLMKTSTVAGLSVTPALPRAGVPGLNHEVRAASIGTPATGGLRSRFDCESFFTPERVQGPA
jgi:hypothetical protein